MEFGSGGRGPASGWSGVGRVCPYLNRTPVMLSSHPSARTLLMLMVSSARMTLQCRRGHVFDGSLRVARERERDTEKKERKRKRKMDKASPKRRCNFIQNHKCA